MKTAKASVDQAQIDELLARGVAEVYPSRDALRAVLMSGKRLRVYNGIDPTAATLHIGHLAPLQKLRQFQALGHEVIMLIGDFTGMIGDPTGKASARKQLTRGQVLANAKRYKEQAASVLQFSGGNAAIIIYNSKWWDKVTLEEFMRLLAMMTVQQVLERDTFQRRLSWIVICQHCGAQNFAGQGRMFGALLLEAKKYHCKSCQKETAVSDDNLIPPKSVALHELLYPALQGYDSSFMGVDVEVGGTDQTFNMLIGRDLVSARQPKRTLWPREKFIITVPLLADASGKKIGKTEGNMVELGATPEDLFGQAMALPDGVIVACFEQCASVPMATVEKAKQRLVKGENPRDLKMELASEFVRMRYGETKAAKAREAFVRTFQKHEVPEGVRRKAVSRTQVSIVDLLIEIGFAASKSEARRVIEQKGVKVDGRVTDDSDAIIEIPKTGILVQKGKRHFIQVVSH